MQAPNYVNSDFLYPAHRLSRLLGMRGEIAPLFSPLRSPIRRRISTKIIIYIYYLQTGVTEGKYSHRA